MRSLRVLALFGIALFGCQGTGAHDGDGTGGDATGGGHRDGGTGGGGPGDAGDGTGGDGTGGGGPGGDGGIGIGVGDGGGLPPGPVAVTTYHNDVRRTGANLRETLLAPAAVATHGLALAFAQPVQGAIVTQALYLHQLAVGATHRDVFFVATSANVVYAFDAADGTLGPLWQVALTDPESPARHLSRGIASTPAIDSVTGALYLVYGTSDQLSSLDSADAAFWLAALDVHDGTVLRQVKLAASDQRDDGSAIAFAARNQQQRAGLLFDRGSIYIGFGGRNPEEKIEFHGWMLRYDARTFAPLGVWNASPNAVSSNGMGASEGAGIWGSAPVADDDGDILFLTGNALADPAHRWYGDSGVKLSPNESGRLDYAGSFTPYDPMRNLELNDVDLGSGGVLLMPSSGGRIVGGGKTGIFYLVDSVQMRELQHFQAFINEYNPSFPVDSNWEGGPHLHAGPVFWQGPDATRAQVYAWSEQDYLKSYAYVWSQGLFDDAHPTVGAVLALGGPDPTDTIMPGGMISLSANGARDGIVWASLARSKTVDPTYGAYPGRLYAFDAVTLRELWETDTPSIAGWAPPTIADGRVIMPTSSGQVLVYTLAP